MTTSSQYGPYAQGYTRATMAGTKRRNTARWSKSQKTSLSSDSRLQFAYLKLESLVNANQPRCVEYVPGSCTHRPSSHLSRVHPKRLLQPVREEGFEGVLGEED